VVTQRSREDKEVHALLSHLSEQVRECLQRAANCARDAAAQTDAKMKQDFLDLERRWLSLARSYQFSERLGDFCAEAKRKTGALPKSAGEK
jgi:hypothetical protein